MYMFIKDSTTAADKWRASGGQLEARRTKENKEVWACLGER